MTDDLPTPLSVSTPALSPVLFMLCWPASFHLVFGRPIFLFPRISILGTSPSMCLFFFSPLPNRFSRVFVEGCVTLVVPRMHSFLILSFQYFLCFVGLRLSILFSVVLSSVKSSFSLVYPSSALYSVCVHLFASSLLLPCPRHRENEPIL